MKDNSASINHGINDRRLLSGFRWSALREVVTGIVSIFGVIVYTNYIQPEDLGAYGLAFLVYNGLVLFVQAPIRDAVVYFKEEEDQRYSSTAFWILALFSVSAVICILIFADNFARFYQSAQSASLTRGMALAFLFQATAVVPLSMLLKKFQYRLYESLQTIAQLLLIIGWVALSVMGLGAWALVYSTIFSSAFLVCGAWISTRYSPRIRIDQRAFTEIFRYSRSLLGSRLIRYLNANLDNASVGTLGERALGWYNFGETQSSYLGYTIGASIARVSLPAMAEVKTEPKQVWVIYIRMVRLAAAISFPLICGAILLADLGVAILVGSVWMESVPVLRAYLFMWLMYTLLEITDAASSAAGKPSIRFRIDIYQLPFYLLGLAAGLIFQTGIGGIAWIIAGIRFTAGLFYIYFFAKSMEGNFREFVSYISPILGYCLIMCGPVFLLRQSGILLVPTGFTFLSGIIAIGGYSVIGGVIYFLLLFLMNRNVFNEVFNTLVQIIKPNLSIE